MNETLTLQMGFKASLFNVLVFLLR